MNLCTMENLAVSVVLSLKNFAKRHQLDKFTFMLVFLSTLSTEYRQHANKTYLVSILQISQRLLEKNLFNLDMVGLA